MSKPFKIFGFILTVFHLPRLSSLAAGQPITARSRVYFPSIIGDVCMLLGASVVDTPIPLLASNTLLETLDAVIDIGKQQVFFRKIGVTVDIIKFQGHLAISISSFDADSHRLPVWKTLSHKRFWEKPHPEIIIPGVTDLEPVIAQSTNPGVFAVEDATSATTSMAEAMVFSSPDGAQLGVGRTSSNERNGEIGYGTENMDDAAGPRCDASSARADDARQEGATGEPIGLPTSGLAKVRKQKRILQPVPSMPSGAQVEHQSREMGNGWKAFVSKIFFACAILFKYLASTTEIHYEQSQSQTPAIFSSTFDEHYDSTIGGWGNGGRFAWGEHGLGGACSSSIFSANKVFWKSTRDSNSRSSTMASEQGDASTTWISRRRAASWSYGNGTKRRTDFCDGAWAQEEPDWQVSESKTCHGIRDEAL